MIESTGNTVQSCYIGTNSAGTASGGTPMNYGVIVAAADNLIGGGTAGTGNVVSGNAIAGIVIGGVGTTGNVVAGNLIGTNSAGTAALGNTIGILIQFGAANNWIGVNSVHGPMSADQGNVIAGNSVAGSVADGIVMQNSGTTGNVVAGNLIGLNVSSGGQVIDGLGDGFAGVLVQSGASGNWIGVNAAAGPGTENALQRNVISGSYVGVSIDNPGSAGNLVAGNLIGTDPSGTTAVPNQSFDAPLNYGVVIAVGASSNLIGTSGQDGANDALERNVISGNTQAGVYIYEFQGAQGAPTTGNVVAGNFIGTNEADTAALANGYGVLIALGAANNWVGVNPVYGAGDSDEGNVISGSTYAGVLIENSGTTGNVVAGDLIGTDAAGTQAIPNVNGVLIFGGASGDTIGGTAAPARNVVSGNTNAGVYLSDSGTTDNVVLGNYIGTNATGTAPLANVTGLSIGGGASGNTIGGTIAAAANVASGNTDYGVAIESSGTSGNLIEGNYVGTGTTGNTAVPNGLAGISIGNQASDNTVGGIVAGSRNVISGNDNNGIEFGQNGTTANVVLGNDIGTNAAGTAALLT